MSCFEAEALFVEQQDGRLDPAQEVRLESHLESCQECRERAAAWRALVPAMREAAPPAPSMMRLRRMEVEIERKLASGAPPLRKRVSPLAWIGSGAAVLAAAAAVLLVLRAWQPPPPGPRVETPRAPVPFATVMRSSGAAPGLGVALEVDSELDLP
jgi:anti-sigma factor RsiW